MRYLVSATLIPGRESELARALEEGTLGKGTVFEEEIQRALRSARVERGVVQWTETCFCETPLKAEREVLDRFFTIQSTDTIGEDPPLIGEDLPRLLARNA